MSGTADPYEPPPLPAFQYRLSRTPSVVQSGGPERIYDERAADPGYEPSPVLGFSVADVNVERLRRAVLAASWSVDDFRSAPLLWEGDQA